MFELLTCHHLQSPGLSLTAVMAASEALNLADKKVPEAYKEGAPILQGNNNLAAASWERNGNPMRFV